MPFMSLYLKGRFYANLAIKYLMTSFYATAIGAKCIMMYSLDTTYKGKILRQLLKLPDIIKGSPCDHVIYANCTVIPLFSIYIL